MASILRVFGFFVFCLCALPTSGAAQQSPVVRFAFGGGWDALPAIVAIERGFFDQEELVVSGLSITSAQAVANSLVAGSTDFAAIPQRTFLAFAVADLPIAAVAVGSWGTEMELIAKPAAGISDLSQIKGHTIAVSRTSDALPVLVRLLNRAKLRPSDVNIRYLEGTAMPKALDSESIDAIFDTRHLTSVLVESGKAVAVLDWEGVKKNVGSISATPLVTRKALIESDPATVLKVVRAWIKALAYIQQDPLDAGRLLQIYLHRHGAKVEASLAQTWITMSSYNLYSWTDNAVADAEYNAWGLKEAGAIKTVPKLAGFIDNRFVEQAFQTVKIQK